MIETVEIENLRGIREGRLSGLTGLTLLTGVNGCGKSTVLDALLVGASPDPGGALAQVVSRRPATRNGARWVIRAGETRGWVVLSDSGAGELERFIRLVHAEDGYGLQLSATPDVGLVYAEVRFEPSGFVVGRHDTFGDGAHEDVHLIDPGLPVPLHQTYSEVVRQGRRREALALLSDLVPGLEGLEILAESDDTPALYVVGPDGGVPLGVAGDGVQAFAQLALKLAARPGGLVLVEEPEVYQHPRAIRQSARALVAASRRGVQVVATTHSLELIDAVVAESGPDDLERLSLFTLALDDGLLRSSRYAGDEVALARETVESDLR